MIATRQDETMFDEMKRYVRFTDDDSRRLAAFGRHAQPHFERLAAEFYDRTREHEGAHRVFTSEEQISHLRRSLVVWMERLFAGPHDESYFQERAKIGRAHVKVGLPQRYMFTGMAMLRAAFEEIIERAPAEDVVGVRTSLAKLLDLELAIMLETYRDDYVSRLQNMGRQERDQLRLALASREQRYASAVELAGVLVVALDARGRVVMFNREAENVSGYARDELTGERFVERLIPEDERDEVATRLAQSIDPDHPLPSRWELPLRTRSGAIRIVRWQLTNDGSPRAEDRTLFAIGQDVTDERALHERTLQNEKLAAVGTLAAGLAHEIRNPLNGALLHVTYLERALNKGSRDPEALAAVRFVSDEIKRLSSLVKDFLVFARPSPPQLKPTDLNAVCKRAVELLGDEAARANVRLTMDPASNELEFALDPEKIEQVLLNLIRNAIEALVGRADGVVTVRTRRTPRNAIVDVEDNGPGIATPDAPIFDAFYSTKPDGTGLGLAIVHRVVHDHRGTVDVDSKPGRTVFRVTLPMAARTNMEIS